MGVFSKTIFPKILPIEKLLCSKVKRTGRDLSKIHIANIEEPITFQKLTEGTLFVACYVPIIPNMKTKNSLGWTTKEKCEQKKVARVAASKGELPLDLIAYPKETKGSVIELFGKQLRKKRKVTISVPFVPDIEAPSLSQDDLL